MNGTAQRSRLLPRSLFGRTALLIVTLIVLGQLGGALMLRDMLIRPRLQQAALAVANNVLAVRAGLQALPSSERARFVQQFNQRALAAWLDEHPHPPRLQRLLTPLERQFVSAVSQRLDDPRTEVIWRREAGGSLEVRLSFDGRAADQATESGATAAGAGAGAGAGAEHYWLRLPGALPAREISGVWLATSLLGAAIAVAGGVLIQRRLNRPLRQIVRAAQTVAQGGIPAPLPEDGPTETATVSRSFNRMVRSLADTERERALMLAGVSHDLRTPLARLRLGVELLRDKADAELATSMTRSVEQMDAIIDQFLDFARPGDQEPLQSTSLDGLADGLVREFADHGRQVAFEAGAPVAIPMRADALRRALGNLLENAWRHGRPPVAIRTFMRDGWAGVEVTDAGSGVPDDQIEALKQPFRRAQPARSGPAGAGLGLAIVDRVVRSHGGRFELGRAPAGGLRATIWLPPAGGRAARV